MTFDISYKEEHFTDPSMSSKEIYIVKYTGKISDCIYYSAPFVSVAFTNILAPALIQVGIQWIMGKQIHAV